MIWKNGRTAVFRHPDQDIFLSSQLSFAVMKKQVTQKKCFNKKPGFTLVETAIAMGMVAVMISSFMVVFGPALEGIDKSLSAKEADRLTNALELELTTIKNDDVYSSPIEKTYYWVRFTHEDSNFPVLVYQYRGNPNSVRTDGTLNPYPYNAANPGTPGVNYVIQTSVRRLNDTVDNSKIQAELVPGVLEGKVYYVKLLQLRTNSTDGSLEMPSNPWHVYNAEASLYTRVILASYSSRCLPFELNFMRSNQPCGLISIAQFQRCDSGDADSDPDALGKPVVTKNMAVMR